MSSRYSMRSLRSSLAANNLSINQSISSTRAVKNSQVVTAYTAVPKQRLNLVDSQVNRNKKEDIKEILSWSGLFE